MVALNQLRKTFLFSSLVLLSCSHFAYGNAELSFNFGKKFQEGGAFKGGYNLLYRIPITEGSSTALGLRLNVLQKIDKSLPDRTNLLFTFLTNYRFYVAESVFTGVIFGMDVLKTYSLSDSVGLSGRRTLGVVLVTNEYLWDRFTAEIGLELGYSVTPNFFFRLELGYDLLSFKCIGDIENLTENNITLSGNVDEECTTKFNGVYATLGVGYHF